MIKIVSVLSILLLGSFVWSKDLDCQISSNNEVILKNRLTTQLKQSIGIGKTTSIAAYVTQYENNAFSVEAFLAEYEARIYAVGVLTQNSDILTASFWGRDSLIDISCKLVN